MIKSQRFRVSLVLGMTCISAVCGWAQTTLTATEAAGQLIRYRGPVQRVHATFPEAVSDGPPLTSMGPASVNDKCYAGWRNAMTTLQRKGYLNSFRQAEHEIGIVATEVTRKGEAFFGHLTPGSFYCTVRIVPDLEAAEVRIGAIQVSADGNRALVEFRSPPSEPFRIMWENELFADGCGADVDAAAVIDQQGVVGHAHFQLRQAAWQVETVFVGEHHAEE